mmetsp:Transcript_110142/g.322261  ORF Transcript_110142/g.322261 Transcript_110142/m.322261 type:complete len:255 (-) Transcript_110142:1559-2323(-)
MARSASFNWYKRVALKGAAMASAIIKMASSQIRWMRAAMSPSSPSRLRGVALVTASATAPTTPDSTFENSAPSASRRRMEHVQQTREATASNGMGSKQMAATAKVCLKFPVQCASRIDSATVGRMADCTKTLVVPEIHAMRQSRWARKATSLLADRGEGCSAASARRGKRMRSLRKGRRLGKASSTEATYARLTTARTREGSSSGVSVRRPPEPGSEAVAAGSSAPRPRPRSLTRKIEDWMVVWRSLVLTEAST